MKRIFKQEIEVKLRVADAAEMRRRLRRLGGRVVRRVYESNTLFDTPRGTLRKQGRLLRLRKETTLRGKGSGTGDQGSGKNREMGGQGKARGGARYVLTMKGPGKVNRGKHEAQAISLRYSRYKVREEMEFVIADPRAFLALAAQEWLRAIFRYEKYRTSYRVPGAGAHVEFDETPAGEYLEVEGFPRAIDRVARRLGFEPTEYITRSYAALHVEACRKRGVRAGDMMFGSRKK